MLMAGGLCAVVVVALGPWLPALLFDEAPVDVGDAVALTLILCASSLATQAGLIAHKGLELRERTRTMVHLMLVSLVVNAAISWTTVSWLGMYGPAWGILGGSLCYLALAGRYRPQ
jgi:O-antigen/teichoic acid export membrane protein